MTTNPAQLRDESGKNNSKGNLQNTLIRTLFVFTIIFLAIVGTAGYVNTRSILQERNSTTPNSQIIGLAITNLVITGILLVTILAITYWAYSRIQQLKSLASVTRRFADGDRGVRTNVRSKNEIGQLAGTFNLLADDLAELYHSLEQKVEERTQEIQIAAEVAQDITTSSANLDEVLKKTTELLVQKFGYYQSSIFLIDFNRKNAVFKAGYGPATQALFEKAYSLEIGSQSVIGWVSASNQPRVVTDTGEDTLHLKHELLPETRSEACVPISFGNFVYGVLDIQSTKIGTFGKDAIIMLQTLASQIATAIQTSELIASSQLDMKELERLYRSSKLIARAKDENEIFHAGIEILKEVPYPVILFTIEQNTLRIIESADKTRSLSSIPELPSSIPLDILEVNNFLSRGTVIVNKDNLNTPNAFRVVMRGISLVYAALLPITARDSITAIVLLGSRNQPINHTNIQPYEYLTELISLTLEKSYALREMSRHLKEVESLASINELVSSTSDIESFYQALLGKIRETIGDYNLLVALYDEKTNSISIPFSYEDGNILSIESFPLGEGLTSILLRSAQPLMIVENTEQRAAELGAKIVGAPARSWMGAPLLVHSKAIGALIIQDIEKEQAFDEDDLKFFTTIAGQVAGVINNVRLLTESQQKALQLETAAEIAKDISGLLDLDELLIKAVNLIRERFDFYHASIFLNDDPKEFAVIRESTGDAGAEMKREGYKIGVGSKSIVGFVTGKGETLVVNDTSKDVTYYPNPLLPKTRAEAAIPLKVGERIIGALDVQSTQPYVFTDENLRSLQILADQLAVAVVNSELFSDAQEHLSQHRLLHHITTTTASGATLDEALENAVSGLQVTLGGDRVTILLADQKKEFLEVKASIGYADEISSLKIEIGKGITGWVAAHKRPLRVRDVTEDPRYISASANTKSELAVPLIYRNELLGVLNVESELVGAYNEDEEEMLGTMGGSLAAIIANAKLLEHNRIQAERDRIIQEVVAKIRRSTDMQSILMTTTSEITRLTGAKFAKIEIEPELGKPIKENKQG